LPTDPPVIFLHVGAMKTGTTFLQQLMSANRDTLAEAGYLFPGKRWGDQTRATRDVLGLTSDPRVKARTSGMWARLSRQMLAHPGRASVFSMEFLSFAGGREARRVVRSLDGATVHVVLTVRDAIAGLPSQWQTNARNNGRASWPEFVEAATAASHRSRWRLRHRDGGAVGGAYLRAQDVPRMLRAWGSAVPAGRLHVVTVPPRGADRMLLWERFAEVLEVDPAACRRPVEGANNSLGHASADLMRRVNARLGAVRQSDYDPTMKYHLARRVLSPRAAEESRARLDLSALELGAEWNRRVRAAVAESGARLVGDPADLPDTIPPALLADAPTRLTDPDPAEVLAAAAAARTGLGELVEARTAQLRARGAGDGRSARDASAAGPDVRGRATDPVDAAVDEVAGLASTAIALYRRLREVQAPQRARGRVASG
jgi:hypothetical protein